MSKQVLPTLVPRPSLGQEASFVSNQSDTTLEFHDAPLPEDFMETQKKHRPVDGFDREVTVKLPSSEEDLSIVEIHEREELPSIATREKELENLPSGPSLSNTEEAHSLELELPVNVENNLEKEVTEEHLQETSQIDIHVQVIESEHLLQVHKPSETLEGLAEVSVHSDIQELRDAEESEDESSIVVEAANVKPVEEYAAPSTSEEAVGKEEEPVEQEPDIEPSVDSELPTKELVSHEPVADAAVYTHIIVEPRNREECEESMETSGKSLSRTLHFC